MIKKLKKEHLFIGLLAGILLLIIAIPVEEKEEVENEFVEEQQSEDTKTDSMEEALESALQKISGVGHVEVLITYEDEGRIVIEKDTIVSEELIQESDSNGGSRTTTITRNENETVYGKSELPYVVQQFSPTIKGILVVAEGGDHAVTKEKILETIQALFGLDVHKISIMKMEVTK